MQPLFGSEWKSRTEVNIYNNEQNKPAQFQRQIDFREMFQDALGNRFELNYNQSTADNHHKFGFTIPMKHRDKIQVCLFIYNYMNMKGKLINKTPIFSYRLSSIYKLPLSQHQATSFMFHHLFNTIQASNLFISIEFLQKSSELIIQLSKYQSDIVNLSVGKPRLNGTYWKPILVQKSDIEIERQINLFIFIEKIINELPQVKNSSPFTCNYSHQNAFTSSVFKILKNPLNFINLADIDGSKIDLQEYFSRKQKISFLKNEEIQDLRIQYMQHVNQKQDHTFSVILYLYNFKQTKDVFLTSDLLFSISQLQIIRIPTIQRKFFNAFFKQTSLIMNCNEFYLSLEVDSYNHEIIIQISRLREELWNKNRGHNRLETQWTPSSEKQVKFSQDRVQTFENIIRIAGNSLNKSGLFGAQKAPNTIIHTIFDCFE